MMKQMLGNSYLFGAQRAVHRGTVRAATSTIPASVDRAVARLFRQAGALPGAGVRGRTWPTRRSSPPSPSAPRMARCTRRRARRPQSRREAGLGSADDQRLPLPRQPLGAARSAQAPRAAADRRTRSVLLRLHRGRPRPELQRRLVRRGARASRPCARSSRRCGRPTAARSAPSTCTSADVGAEALDPGAPRADPRRRRPSRPTRRSAFWSA